MRHKLIHRLVLTAFLSFMLFLPMSAQAVPIFQVYIDGGTAGDMGSDEDTWFSGNNPFDLYVVGASYENPNKQKKNSVIIDPVYLVVSVPEGETGTLSFTTSDEDPFLVSGGADKDILTDVSGYDGYGEKGDFLPVNFNEHYPFKDDVSDFLVYNLELFDDSESNLRDYNAEDGTITTTSAVGEQKEYSVSWSGFSRLHFDVYGRVTDKQGTGWEINPGSHDSTAVPEPGTMLLLGTGLIALAGLGRKEFRGKTRG